MSSRRGAFGRIVLLSDGVRARWMCRCCPGGRRRGGIHESFAAAEVAWREHESSAFHQRQASEWAANYGKFIKPWIGEKT